MTGKMMNTRGCLCLFFLPLVKTFTIYQLTFLPHMAEEWKKSGNFYDYQGYQIFYRDVKGNPHSNDVLLALNGFPTSSWEYHKIMPRLMHSFRRIIAPDFLGTGFSSKPQDIEYKIAYQADIIEGLVVRTLNVTSVHILCHDLGDVVTQELLQRLKQRRISGEEGLSINSLVFLNGALYPNAETLILPQKLMVNFLTKPFAKYLVIYPLFRISFQLLFAIKPTEIEFYNFYSVLVYNEGPLVTARILQYHQEQLVEGHRWVVATRETDVPLSIIVGVQDNTLASKSAFEAECKYLYPQAKVYKVRGAGHYPHFEKPTEVADILDNIWKPLLRSNH